MYLCTYCERLQSRRAIDLRRCMHGSACCIWSGRGPGGGRPQIETKIKKSSCVCQENQVIKAVFSDQKILIAVTNGNTRPMVVTTPYSTAFCNSLALAKIQRAYIVRVRALTTPINYASTLAERGKPCTLCIASYIYISRSHNTTCQCGARSGSPQ